MEGAYIDAMGVALGTIAYLIGTASLLSLYRPMIGRAQLLFCFAVPALVPLYLYFAVAIGVHEQQNGGARRIASHTLAAPAEGASSAIGHKAELVATAGPWERLIDLLRWSLSLALIANGLAVVPSAFLLLTLANRAARMNDMIGRARRRYDGNPELDVQIILEAIERSKGGEERDLRALAVRQSEVFDSLWREAVAQDAPPSKPETRE